MTTTATASGQAMMSPARFSPYVRWIESLGVPIYREYYLEDLRTIRLGRWEARECDGAFLELTGQQGVTGAYVIEIPPGKTLPPFRVAMDEVLYALQGRGLTSIRANESTSPKTFEWQNHSLFVVPGNHSYQLRQRPGQPAGPAPGLQLSTAGNVGAPQSGRVFQETPSWTRTSCSGEGTATFTPKPRCTRRNPGQRPGRIGSVTSFPTCGPGTSWTR